MSIPRSRVLERLRECATPTTAAALASSMNLHVNTVREHLEGLVDRGVAVRHAAPVVGRGRPAWQYEAASNEADADPRVRDYIGLAIALAGQVSRSSADPRAGALAAGETWGRALAAGIDRTSPARARWRTVELLADLGFDPQPDARAAKVRLRRCPLLDAAISQPDIVCTVHLGLVRGVLSALGAPDEQAALTPFAEPGACVLHLPATRAGARANRARVAS